MRYGAAHGYPALFGIIDPRDYLPDTSQTPLYHTVPGVPIYPTRPALTKSLVAAGANAWRTYASEASYQDIDLAIKVLAKEGALLP